MQTDTAQGISMNKVQDRYSVSFVLMPFVHVCLHKVDYTYRQMFAEAEWYEKHLWTSSHKLCVEQSWQKKLLETQTHSNQ